MNICENILSGGEQILLQLRELFYRSGYTPYRMSKFEEYDLYAGNKDFLVSDRVITFNDTDGKLLALKPDVTLSIIKNSPDLPGETRKVSYAESVYRVGRSSGTFREISQAGVECFGRITGTDLLQMLELAGASLKQLSENAVLAVSDLLLTEALVTELSLPTRQQKALYDAISRKNLPAVDAICGGSPAGETLKALLQLSGDLEEAVAALADRCPPILKRLLDSPIRDMIRVDFSVIGDAGYYNGIIFKGYISGVPAAVLSGGQYDRLMRKLKRQSNAIGFAVYTDLLDHRAQPARQGMVPKQDDFLNVALPKGRLGEKIYGMFAAAGYPCPAVLDPGRKLIFENPEKKIRYFWVKPSDVAIYVERGSADIGAAGKDILMEYQPDVYELLDLKRGKCSMAVAAPKGFADDPGRTLRIATKFSNIARDFYQARGRDIDIIHLNGSIELAPILGLSDVIVDIVETGNTLRENNLEVVEQFLPISARLIANKSAAKFKQSQLEALSNALAAIVEEEV